MFHITSHKQLREKNSTRKQYLTSLKHISYYKDSFLANKYLTQEYYSHHHCSSLPPPPLCLKGPICLAVKTKIQRLLFKQMTNGKN